MKYEFTLRDGSKFAVPAEIFDAVAKRKVEASDLRDQVKSLQKQIEWLDRLNKKLTLRLNQSYTAME